MSKTLAGLHRLPVAQRWQKLAAVGGTVGEAAARLQQQAERLPLAKAERMVENVVGVFGLPLGLGLHLVVDGAAVVVPMVVEEPSIVAAVSSAGKVAAVSGGFATHCDERLMVGQVEIRGLADVEAARQQILADAAAWLARANAAIPGLVGRGGGARQLTVELLPLAADARPALVVHLHVDTCDAMGANAINSLCEHLGPQLATSVGGNVGLQILSNLTLRSVVRASVRLSPEHLAFGEHDGVAVRDGIAGASAFAEASVHRAVTHNKGIMNGIDAVALATGNDWRAIEANAHAYAARNGRYAPLSRWTVDAAGALCGELTVPLKVGTVGGNFAVNPGVDVAMALLGRPDAARLSAILAAVGLAQNFAALRALSTQGIQRGHMALHARSVAASAGVSPAHVEAVVAAMVAAGEVKVAKAQALAAALAARPGASLEPPCVSPEPSDAPASPACVASSVAAAAQVSSVAPVASVAPAALQSAQGEAAGKLLLLGEHAVVYGASAVALPLPLAIRATARSRAGGGIWLHVPAWQIDEPLQLAADGKGLHRPLACIVRRLQLTSASFHLTIDARVPRAMGLGSSAALAVAVVRALDSLYALGLTDEAVVEEAYAAETVAHGTASGVDNTLSAYGRPLVFRRDKRIHLAPLVLAQPLHLVVGQTQEPSLTHVTVAKVRAARTAHPRLIERVLGDIDAVVQVGIANLRSGDLPAVGAAMNVNHGLLNALGVSTPALEQAVATARQHGALGAKLTGGGGGGSMVALCRAEDVAGVVAALQAQQLTTLTTCVPATAGSSAPTADSEAFVAPLQSVPSDGVCS